MSKVCQNCSFWDDFLFTLALGHKDVSHGTLDFGMIEMQSQPDQKSILPSSKIWYFIDSRWGPNREYVVKL